MAFGIDVMIDARGDRTDQRTIVEASGVAPRNTSSWA